METRFEINIKKIGIKGDDTSLYITFNERLILKLAYKDIETVVGGLLAKAKQETLPAADVKVIEAPHADEE